MLELFRRLLKRPVLTIELIVASLFINVLGLASTVYVILVLNRYIAYGVDATLATLTAAALIAVVFEFAFRQARLKLAQGISRQPNEVLAGRVFEALTRSKTMALGNLPQGMRRQAIGGLEAVKAAYNAANVSVVLDFPFALIFIAVIFLISTPLALIAATILAVVFLIGFIGGVALQAETRNQTQEAAKGGALVNSALEASDTVRAFNAAAYLGNAFRDHIIRLDGVLRRIAARRGLLQSISQSALTFMTIAIICVGARLVVEAELEVGTLIGANILAGRALSVVTRFAALGEVFVRAKQSLALCKRLMALPLEFRLGATPPPFKGNIVLKDVAFAFPGGAAPLFESLNLRLTPGQVLAVVGENGAGKTTLCRLLAGLIEPQRGQVLIDGMDMRQVSPEWWRRQIVYLQQEPSFLNATIAENLLVNAPELDEGGLASVIEAAGLRRFVDESHKGHDTMITDNGRSLALGIRRRLALARALTTDGMLVLFDEPTESLDSEGVAAVYAVMNRFKEEGKTIIVCSRDPNILKAAHFALDLNRKPTPRIMKNRGPRDKPGKVAAAPYAASGRRAARSGRNPASGLASRKDAS